MWVPEGIFVPSENMISSMAFRTTGTASWGVNRECRIEWSDPHKLVLLNLWLSFKKLSIFGSRDMDSLDQPC